MTIKFLKLTTRIINSNYIRYISFGENKYLIDIVSANHSGFLIGGTGFLSTNHENITVCGIKSPQDFITVTEWISQVNKV